MMNIVISVYEINDSATYNVIIILKIYSYFKKIDFFKKVI